MFTKNWNFHQKLKFSSEIETFIKNWIFSSYNYVFLLADENRFSLASAITIQVCSPNTGLSRLNDLGRMAAELTSMVPAMAQEWIGILQAIMPKVDSVSKTYSDVLTRIDLGNILTAEQLAVLYGIMIARNTIRLSDVIHTVLQCLHKTNGHQSLWVLKMT